MGFQDDKHKMLAALRAGRIIHEERSYQHDKNLLASGQVAEIEVVLLLEAVRGHQAEASAHHFDPEQQVWIMQPVSAGVRWYLKAYLAEEAIVFLSCHPSEGERP